MQRHIYFDYAASTPVAPDVLRAMEPYFLEKFGNPGSLHSFGQEAIAAVDKSRETIARALGRPPDGGFREIIFTGSATEANNLALRGAIKGYGSKIKNPRIIVSSIEHESILETAIDLERDGVEVIYLPVNNLGVVDLKKLKKSLNERTVLVSIMLANNVVGTIQPIVEIAKIIQEFRNKKEEKPKNKNSTFYILHSRFYPLFHTDAAQAFQFLDCNVNELGVDMLTISGQKIYGPKGTAALYVRANRVQGSGSRVIKSLNPSGYTLVPIITGGGQEFGLRSGTENVPAIVGFAEAVRLIAKNREKEGERIAKLRDYFWTELKKIYPRAELNGSEKDSERLPHILNVYFPGYQAEDFLTKLDLAGVAASAGSACRARVVGASYVIDAMGFPARAKSSIRFSFGRPTRKEDIDTALKIMKIIFRKNT
ncbi:MAG: cysteine desulfurase family protein [bacterium]|nr:cysteine desulfurase family protein [bacterium]